MSASSDTQTESHLGLKLYKKGGFSLGESVYCVTFQVLRGTYTVLYESVFT